MFGFTKKTDNLASTIDKCRMGDRQSMKYIYDHFSENMYAVSLRYVNDTMVAEDIVSTGFIKAFERLNQLDDSAKFAGWLKKIIVNQCLDYLKSTKNKFENIEEHMFYIDSNNFKSPLDEMGLENILQLINLMPDGYKTVFNLYEIEGYNHNEIAGILDVSVSTSKSQLMKSKIWLREKLKHYNEYENYG